MTATIFSPYRILEAVPGRVGKGMRRIYLASRSGLAGQTFWMDYGFIKFPYRGRGDRQEMYYHVNAREWWRYEWDLLAPHVKPGSVVVDVGANLGFMSAILSNLAGAGGCVHSFEPSPEVFSTLCEVIEANQYKNVTPYNLGCGREEQVLTLYCPPSSGEASLRPASEIQNSIQKQVPIRIVRLDDFLGPKLDRLDLIKIDTEGFEDEVLGGAVGLLKRFKPTIYIELCGEYETSSKAAISILLDLGYSFNRPVDLSDSLNGQNFLAFPDAV